MSSRPTPDGVSPHQPTKNAAGPNVTQGRGRFEGESPTHRRPGRPPAYRPVGDLSVQTAVIVREYELALACYTDAVKSKALAIRREGVARRRLAGARRACVQAGVDVASLEESKSTNPID
jgi:hypothetical protein